MLSGNFSTSKLSHSLTFSLPSFTLAPSKTNFSSDSLFFSEVVDYSYLPSFFFSWELFVRHRREERHCANGNWFLSFSFLHNESQIVAKPGALQLVIRGCDNIVPQMNLNWIKALATLKQLLKDFNWIFWYWNFVTGKLKTFSIRAYRQENMQSFLKPTDNNAERVGACRNIY